MEFRLDGPLEIEDLRHHPAEQIEHLRALLAGGAAAQPDPRRRHFYEVEDGALVFYIHVPPSSGKVHLLAVWNKHSEDPASAGGSPAPSG
jgi:hypothetical protein